MVDIEKVKSDMEDMRTVNATPLQELSDSEHKQFMEGYVPVKNLLAMPAVKEAMAPKLKKFKDEVRESGNIEEFAKHPRFITPTKEAMTGSDLAANLAIMQFFLDKSFPYSFDDPQRNIMQICKPRVVPNFKNIRIYRTFETEDLLQVQPGGAYHGTSFSDVYQDVGVLKYGRRFPITWESLQNDVIGEFADLQDKLVRSSKRTMFKLVTAAFAANSNLYNNTNLNLTSGALAVSTLKAAIQMMESQLDDLGNPINIVAKYLMVPIALKWTALLLLNPTLRTQLAIPSGDSLVPEFELDPIVNPYLDATSKTGWYLFADPAELEALMNIVLDGHPGPEILIKIQDQQMIAGALGNELGSYINDSIDMKIRLFHNQATRFHQATVYSPGN